MVQQKLKAPKNQYNSFGKYNYRSCEDILEGLKPHLEEVKATVILNDEVMLIGDRYYIKARVHFIDLEDGKELNSTAYAREDLDKKGMDLAQVTGSVSSYARKYALNGLFCIDDTKDSDATNVPSGKPQDKPKPQPTVPMGESEFISLAQRNRLFAISKGNEAKIKEVIAKLGYTSTKEIKAIDYDKICKEVEG